MENQKPHHIVSERDLVAYEDYLKENFPENNKVLEEKNSAGMQRIEIENRKLPMPQSRFSVPQMLTSPVFSNGYLRNQQGKLLKVESLVGNTLDTRIGILIDVGADYIAIKLNKSCCSMMIPTASIKYITIIHDNDIGKTAAY